MFLVGRVVTTDGAPLPSDVMVERICSARVRQQVYASSRGDFTMQMGNMADTYVDASGDSGSRYSNPNKVAGSGIPRRELTNCELRASAAGFRSRVVNLMEHTGYGGANASIDVGAIIVQPTSKPEGATVSAAAYKAPANARKAYEQGVDAEKKGKFADARQHFEKAVQLYPKFTNAWFRLGSLLQKDNQNDAARNAYAQAAAIDTKFLPPYLALASLAYQGQNWADVRDFTRHIIDLDTFNYRDVGGYILDLDPSNFAEAYFYNAMANYKLNKFDDAERSGVRAERIDLRARFPQLHLILSDIFIRKNNYPTAASELRMYLELAPQGKNADEAREQLAKLEKLQVPAASPAPSTEKPDQQ